MIHKHHIIPKHMDGTDHPDNIVELTVAEHADAHNLLWCLHKKPEDKLAELCLLGQAKDPEAIRLKAKLGNKMMREALARGEFQHPNKGKPAHPNVKKAASESGKRPKSKEHKANIRNALLGKKYPPERIANMVAGKAGFTHSEETKVKMSETRKSIPLSTKFTRLESCIHCGFETTIGNLTRWHNDNCKHKEG